MDGTVFRGFGATLAKVGAVFTIMVAGLGFGVAKLLDNDDTIGVRVTDEQKALIKHGGVCDEHLHAAFAKALQESKEKATVVDLVLPADPGANCANKAL